MSRSHQVISYSRFSSGPQGSGNSIERQSVGLEQFLAAHPKYVLIDRFADKGISAFRGKHRKTGAMKDLLAQIANGRIKKGTILWVESIDRLTREESWPALDLVKTVLDAGIDIHDDDDDCTYSAPLSHDDIRRMMDQIRRGNRESKRKCGLTTRSWQIKTERIRSRAIKSTATVPWWIDGTADTLPLPHLRDEADSMRKFVKQLELGRGYHSAVKKLTEEGVLGPYKRSKDPSKISDRRWKIGSMRRMIFSDQIKGTFTPKHGPPIENYYTALFPNDPKRIDLLRQKIRRRRKGTYSGRRARQLNVLARIARCECGAPMWLAVTNKQRGSRRILLCRDRTICGHGREHDYESTRRAVLRHVAELDLARIERMRDTEEKRLESELAATRERVEENRQEQRNLVKIAKIGGEAAIEYERLVTMAPTLAAESDRILQELELARRSNRRDAVESIARLERREAEATSDELADLHIALAQEIRRVVDAIIFRPDGMVSIDVGGEKSYLVHRDIVLGTYATGDRVAKVAVFDELGDRRGVSLVATPGDDPTPASLLEETKDGQFGDKEAPLFEDDMPEAIELVHMALGTNRKAVMSMPDIIRAIRSLDPDAQVSRVVLREAANRLVKLGGAENVGKAWRYSDNWSPWDD